MHKTSYFEYVQNNSGGNFSIDTTRGIGPRVWIEAYDSLHADARAQSIGIYFNGVYEGLDCKCCGDRWYKASTHGDDAPVICDSYDFNWHNTVYVHHLNGVIERIKNGE